MEELELKEDYLELSREEQLELARNHMRTADRYSREELSEEERAKIHSYPQLSQIIFKNCKIAAEIFKVNKKWEQYFDAYTLMVANHSSASESILFLEEELPYALKVLGKEHLYIANIYRVLGRAYSEVGEFDIAKENHQKALMIQKEISEISIGSVHSYMGFSELYYKKSRFLKSIHYSHKGLEMIELIHPLDIATYRYILSMISASYIMLTDYEKSIFYSQKEADTLIANFGENYHGLANCYNTIGHSYGEIGNFDDQVYYQQKALSLFTGAKDNRGISVCYSNLCSAYFDVGDIDKALSYALKAKEIRESAHSGIKENRELDLADSYNNLTTIYIHLQKYEVAKKYASQSMEIKEKILGKEHYHFALGYLQLGSIHVHQKEPKKGLVYYQQALPIYLGYFGKKHRRVSKIYKTIADVYMKFGEFLEGIENYHTALCGLFNDSIETDIYHTPKTKDYFLNPLVLEILCSKGSALLAYYTTTNNLRNLQCALDSFECADEVIEQLRRTYRTEGTKLLLAKNTIPVYREGIRVILKAYQVNMLKDLELSFTFSEKAKGILLLSTIQSRFAKSTLDISPELLRQEKQLKVELTYLDKFIQKLTAKEKQGKIDTSDQKILQEEQNRFFDLHLEYNALLKQLETDYPDYYQLKYDSKTVTSSELQTILTENQVVISYFVGKDKLYIFVVTPDEFEVIDLQLPTGFEALVQGFMDALTQHQYAAFTEKSHQLYQLLIAPIRDFLVDDFGFDDEEELKQVFVIPHGVLSYVPFEALVGEEKPLSRFTTIDKVVETLSTAASLDNSWNDLDYLIHHCEISYHYSATLLHRHLLKKQTEEELPNSFAGFAPIYDGSIPSNSNTETIVEDEQANVLQQSAKNMQTWATRSEAIRSDGTWVSLPHSETEAKGIAQLFEEEGLKSETFLREKASKEGFAEAAKRYKFLLVAAHGLVNDEKTALSGLVFYPSSLQPLARQEAVAKVSTLEDRTLATVGDLANSSSSITDNILSMEETHHLDLQADLVVLSSCESGIGTLHKGEGMMAVNRGFLAAGANNVVSTLFKVYDKPSSLLTQYLFEGILEGEEYSSALRLAKLKLMQQPSIDPKSWSGFVLIGG